MLLAATPGESAGDKVSDTTQDVQTWLDSPEAREWLISIPLHILLIIILALVGHWLLRRIIRQVEQHSIENNPAKSSPFFHSGHGRAGRKSSVKKPANTAEDELEIKKATAVQSAKEARRVSRIRTLANVARSAAAIFVWVWAVLAVLDQLGVNIAPLIASAGVIGVALGFGAQALVKDFLSGIFMLIEDQYGIGDCIDLGDGTVGDVESITLRITTVRDIDGALWYVRNGEILKVANHTDSFSIARLQIPVGLSNDTDKVKELINAAALEAARDEEISGKVLTDPVFNGVTEFNPDYMSFRVSIKTLPGEQWAVQRFVYARILNAMNSGGITTPYPHGIGMTQSANGGTIQ